METADFNIGVRMLEGDLIYSIISPIVGVLGLSLGVYVMFKNPHLEMTRTYLAVMVLFLIAGMLDFSLNNASDQAIAEAVGRILVLNVVLIFAGFLYLSSLLPCERRRNWFRSHRLEFIIVILALGVIPAAFVDVKNSTYGWGIPDSFSVMVLLAIVLALIILTLFVLSRAYRSSTDPSVRKQCVLMSIGIVFPVVYSGFLIVLDQMGTFSPPQLAPGFLLTSIVFLYAILRHKLFLIAPVVEDKKEGNGRSSKAELRIADRGCYLIEGKRSDEAYRMFMEDVGEGAEGLLLSRMHPDAIKETYGLVKTPIIWLAIQPGPDRIEPANLSILQHTVVEFLRKGQDVVVMLDGLEYLISNNPIEKVLKTLYAIKDEVMASNSKLLLPIDPEILDLTHLALFEREFEVLKTSGGAGTEI